MQEPVRKETRRVSYDSVRSLHSIPPFGSVANPVSGMPNRNLLYGITISLFDTKVR
jgi:hypothetical protein